MNGNNYRASHHRAKQYLVAEQQQQFSAIISSSNNHNNGNKQHLQADPLVGVSGRALAASYNGLPMHQKQTFHQQASNANANGTGTGNGANSRLAKGLEASDYSMPPMPMPISSASVNQLTDQLSQTHLDHHQASYNHQASYYHKANHHDQNHAITLNPNNGNSLDGQEYYQHYSSARNQSQQQQHQQEVDSDYLNMDYANQLRQSQFKHKYQHQVPSSSSNIHAHAQYHNQTQQQQQQQQSSYDRDLSTIEQNSTTKSTMHVNFNRSSRPAKNNGSNGEAGDDEPESPARKKKYLTAKYGQQQMNLIKKRLKVEMWLYEQLKELAKGTQSEDELDEIDIDLDQILDMEDDSARRNWLKKLLQPFSDLPPDRVDKFICDVIEQSRLL